MKLKELTPEVRQIWRTAVVVQAVRGFMIGLILFIYGPTLYEKFAFLTDPAMALTLVGVIIVVDNGLSIFLEIPTGAIGDAIGRKWTVIASVYAGMVSFLAFGFIPLVSSLSWALSLALLGVGFWSLSYTFFSGTFTAWCVDHLRSKGPDIGYEHLLSKANSWRLLAQMLGGGLGVFLYLKEMHYLPYFISAGIGLFLMAFCLGEMENEEILIYENLRQVSISRITARVGKIIGVGFQVFRQSGIILTVVTVFASYMLTLNLVEYLWPIYLRSKVPAELQMSHWIGLVVLMQFVGAIGSHTLTLWTRKWKKRNGMKTHNDVLRRILTGTALLSALPIIGISILTRLGLDTFWAFAVSIIPIQFAYGIILPCFETLVNNYIPDTFAGERATIMSFASMVRSLFVMLLIIPSVGSSGGTTTVGWALPAGILIFCSIWGNFVLKRKQNKVEDFLID